jgi:hypothetical protein
VGPDRSQTSFVCCYFCAGFCDPHHIGGAGNLPRCVSAAISRSTRYNNRPHSQIQLGAASHKLQQD